MTVQLVALCVDATDPQGLAGFWAGLLDREIADNGVTVLPSDDPGFDLTFRPELVERTGHNQIHLHLTSTSLEDQQATVTRALRLGGQHLDVGQRPEEGHVVLGDPEGNEFCVIEPGNAYLDGCGFLAELACDGSRDVGLFWSAATGWPLVWDRGEETAIQSPRGGAKVAWGGSPVAPRTGKNRLHLHVAPTADGAQQAEVDRLVALGATRLELGQGDVGWVVMADPDGNEFCVLPAPPAR
jgi:predicted enzyme related to lactoylglutathione lyase